MLRYFWKPVSLVLSLFCSSGAGHHWQDWVMVSLIWHWEKKKICYQENSKEMMRRMQEILKNPNGKCLVGIPPRPVSAGFFVNILPDIQGF